MLETPKGGGVAAKSISKQAAELIIQIAIVEGALTGGRVARRRIDRSFRKLGWEAADFEAGLKWARERTWITADADELCLTPKGYEADVFSHLAPRRH